jgi:hypothetical protein
MDGLIDQAMDQVTVIQALNGKILP